MSEGQAESPRARRCPARRATRSYPAAVTLLGAGAEIDALEVEFQGIPLAAAVRGCCTADDPKQADRARRMVEFLLKRGADAKVPSDQPWARRYGRKELVKLMAVTQ